MNLFDKTPATPSRVIILSLNASRNDYNLNRWRWLTPIFSCLYKWQCASRAFHTHYIHSTQSLSRINKGASQAARPNIQLQAFPPWKKTGESCFKSPPLPSSFKHNNVTRDSSLRLCFYSFQRRGSSELRNPLSTMQERRSWKTPRPIEPVPSAWDFDG